jgi:rare lipoprotein A
MKYDKGPAGEFDVSQIPDAVPKWEPISPKGNQTPYTVRGEEYHLLKTAKDYREEGIGSWYGLKFHGELTSNGEVYNMYSMSAAHKTLPLPSYLKVTNLENQRTVMVRVNDRGPFHEGRIIDLSYAAAKKLDYHNNGTARLLLESIVVPKQISKSASSRGEELEDRLAYFVQVAALSNEEPALKLRDSLLAMNLGYESFVKKAKDSNIYRVRVGPVDDLRIAERLKRRLSAAKIGSPMVISRPILAKGS